MISSTVASLLLLFTTTTFCIKYEPDQVLWNLNQNQSATDPLDYWGQWPNHSESVPSRGLFSISDSRQHTNHRPRIGASRFTQ